MAGTIFTLNNVTYRQTDKGYCYKTTGKQDSKGNDVEMRISAKIFAEAFTAYAETDAYKEALEEAKREAEEQQASVKASKAEKAKGKAKKATGTVFDVLDQQVSLTDKQIDFMKHLQDTCFWERGLDSTPWVDILIDEIGGQFAGKPMTVGAMISTLREKQILIVDRQHMNGKMCRYIELTDLGKEIGFRIGLMEK